MDVNQIFKDLSVLVHEQGDIVGECLFLVVDRSTSTSVLGHFGPQKRTEVAIPLLTHDKSR